MKTRHDEKRKGNAAQDDDVHVHQKERQWHRGNIPGVFFPPAREAIGASALSALSTSLCHRRASS